jgi:hypothetical protein
VDVVAVAVAITLLAPAVSVRAQVTESPKAEIFPDPKKFAYGLYTQGELGAVTVFGPAGERLRPGWALGLALGYDLFRWFAVEVRGIGSTHTTDFPSGPQDGELLQLYQVFGTGKLTIRIRHWSVFGDGGVALLRTSTNVLAIANPSLNEARTSLTFGGGLGVDYHTLSRHFSFGVRGSFFVMPKLGKSQALVTTAYLRYAF